MLTDPINQGLDWAREVYPVEELVPFRHERAEHGAWGARVSQ